MYFKKNFGGVDFFPGPPQSCDVTRLRRLIETLWLRNKFHTQFLEKYEGNLRSKQI